MACKSYKFNYSTYKPFIHTNQNWSNCFPQNPLEINMQDDIALITTLKLRILQEPSKKRTKIAKTGSPESPEISDTTDIYEFLCRMRFYSFPVASLWKTSFKLAGEMAEIGRRSSGNLARNRPGGFLCFSVFCKLKNNFLIS